MIEQWGCHTGPQPPSFDSILLSIRGAREHRSLDALARSTMRKLMTHEAGHIFGLGHVANSTHQVMKTNSGHWGVSQRKLRSGIAGCATPEASCPAVVAQIPASAAAGTTITVHLENLLDGCSDTGGDPANFKSGIELELVSVDTAETVLTTSTSDVTQEGTANVSLTIPPGATGTASVVYVVLSLGTVSITG